MKPIKITKQSKRVIFLVLFVCGICSITYIFLHERLLRKNKNNSFVNNSQFFVQLPPNDENNHIAILNLPAMLPKELIEKRLPGFLDENNNTFDGLLLRTHFVFYKDINSWTRKRITEFTSDTLLDKEDVIRNIHIPFNTRDYALFSFNLLQSEQHTLQIEKIINDSSLIFVEENIYPDVSLSCDIFLTFGAYEKELSTGTITTHDSGWILSQLETLRISESGVYATIGGKEYRWCDFPTPMSTLK